MAMQSGGNTFYLAYDQVGSLISIADTAGNVIRSITYDSFGNIIQDSDPDIWIPFGFAAGLYDPDTGLVRFGFREYSPEIGRWTAKDPLLFNASDTDLYGYCLSDPINWIDSLGLEKLILLDPVKDADLYNSAVNMPDILGMLTIYAHGNPYRINKMMADQLADFIQKSGKWRPGMPIKLSSCGSAEGENSIAQELAKILQTDVIGAEGKVWYNPLTGKDMNTPMPPLINNIPLIHTGIPNVFKPGRWVLFSGSFPYMRGTTWEP
jgi:RHS repeat-associated protein